MFCWDSRQISRPRFAAAPKNMLLFLRSFSTPATLSNLMLIVFNYTDVLTKQTKRLVGDVALPGRFRAFVEVCAGA